MNWKKNSAAAGIRALIVLGAAASLTLACMPTVKSLGPDGGVYVIGISGVS